jgi:putative ABC transport system permease protein
MRTFSDLRVAARRLRLAPVSTIAAASTLALAIAANTTIFSAVRAVLLAPTPIHAPDEVVVAWQTENATPQAVVELTYRHLREWTETGRMFTSISAVGSHNWDVILERDGEPTRLWLPGVSAGFFDTLGVVPLHGRAFRPDDDVPSAPAVAILSHRAWQQHFGADPSIVGQALTLDGGAVEIVGVMPPGMDVPAGADLWAPVVPILTGGNSDNTAALDGVGVLYMVGRLRPGIDANTVAAELDRVEQQLDAALPGRPQWGDRVVATPLSTYIFGPARSAPWWLWGAVSLLLLIACANVSGLLLTRLTLRAREHGVRLALGDTPAGLARTWAWEIVLLCVGGGMLGVLLAYWSLPVLLAAAPDDLFAGRTITIDRTVALFSVAVVLVAALLSGLAPILRAARTPLVDAIGSGTRSTAGAMASRGRSALVTAQVAVAVVLLVGAGLLARSFTSLRALDLGFRTDGVLTLVVEPRSIEQPINEWLHELVQRTRGLPDVLSAGAVYLRPLALGPIGQGVLVGLEGQPQTLDVLQTNPTLNYQVATPGYFETMGIRLVRGRLFDDGDIAEAARVAIVSESTARRLWPGEDPIGKRISLSAFTPGVQGRPWRTVVGVVADVRYRGLTDVHLDVYDPARQVGLPANNLVVHTSGNVAAVVAGIRQHAQQLDPTAIVDRISPLETIVARASAPWRLTTWLFSAFASLAFLLSALGLFGLVALDVSERQQEFAVRLALGAPPTAVVGRVVWQAWLRAGIGMTLGIGSAAAGARAMQALLFEVQPVAPSTYGAVVAGVAVVVTLAAWIPARRAAQASPQTLLRRA